MTKDQFNSQKWYKHMPVWINGQKYLVISVDLYNGKIGVITKKDSGTGSVWDFSLVDTHPRAIELVAEEDKKQIGKGYTVVHDVEYVKTTRLGFDDIAVRLLNNGTGAPDGWNQAYWNGLIERPLIDKLRIAATWIIRQMDLIMYLEEKEGK